MGQLIEAFCLCGFTETLTLGSGIKYHGCNAPALCNRCGSLVSPNYLSQDPRCWCGGTVTFYNDPTLQGVPDQNGQETPEGLSWGVDSLTAFVLPEGTYFCPKCGKMAMRFREAGFWD